MTPLDEKLMRRAIALSRRGLPAPNPHVGCVIACGEQIVGEGWHDQAGGPHAEVVALRVAGAKAKGSTAYVTLEPCNHHGRTPPCTEALIHAGVARVVAACRDPYGPASGGLRRLAEAGLLSESGLLEQEARRANTLWLTAVERERPYVILKAAISLDGRIATRDGRSKWITGAEARREAHRLRAECGAVLVGRRTVEIDDPLLTVRSIRAKNQPLRIVLDPHRSLPHSRRIFNGDAGTLRIVAEGANGNELSVDSGADGFDLSDLLSLLYGRGVRGLLVEGGAKTIGSFMSAGLVDRIELFVAGKVFGAGPAWIEKESLREDMPESSFSFSRIRRLGSDVQITCMPIRGDRPTELTAS